jgi:nucleotide-binding universal stress UspA family protein
MKRFKNILVVPDEPSPDDLAVRRSLHLARANSAKVTLAWPLEQANGDRLSDELERELTEGFLEQLDSPAAAYRDAGLEVETTVLQGRPFMEIIRRVLGNGHDLVMKTARGRRLFKDLFFGTTGLHLLRKCPCPVWIVNPEGPQSIGRVLAVVEPDREDDERAEVARMVMQLSTSLALLEGSDLHVMHTWSVPYEDMIRHSPFLRVRRTEAEGYFEEIEQRHRQNFDELVQPFAELVPQTQMHLVKGLPHDVIPDFARDNEIHVVVMATLGRSGVPGLLIENAAEGILNRVHCSVLAVKPSAFVSPVTL